MKTTVALDRTLAAIRKKISTVNTMRDEIRNELDAVITEAERMKAELGLVDTTAPRGQVSMTKPHRQMSPEARENIARAARNRWVAYRKAKAKAAKNTASKPKAATRKSPAKNMSAISKGMKKYWARRKKTEAAAQKDNLVQMPPRTGTNG